MVRKLNSNIIRLHSIDSTNNYANAQINAGAAGEGTVFLAYEQTAGRGQLKNFWESEPGMNLTFSLVLAPDFLEIRRQFMLSKVITLGIHSALNKYVDGLKIKWPNDIYAGNRKLGGILIENSVMLGLLKNSVAGIGLNINQTDFRSNAPNPVSMKMLTNQHYNCDELLKEILERIGYFYECLSSGEFESIDDQFQEVLFRRGEKHSFRTDDETFDGEITGVNSIGQLLIRNNDGNVRAFHFKEVEFLFAEGLND